METLSLSGFLVADAEDSRCFKSSRRVLQYSENSYSWSWHSSSCCCTSALCPFSFSYRCKGHCFGSSKDFCLALSCSSFSLCCTKNCVLFISILPLKFSISETRGTGKCSVRETLKSLLLVFKVFRAFLALLKLVNCT